MKNSRNSLAAAIACGASAMIWIARMAVNIYYGTWDISMPLLLLDILCALVLIAAFVVSFRRYRAQRK